MPISVRSEIHLLACKVKSVEHFANQGPSSSVKHEICTATYKLKMTKAVYRMELIDTRALSCVMKVVKTLCDQQKFGRSQFGSQNGEYQTFYERKSFIVKTHEVALILGCCYQVMRSRTLSVQ